MVRVRKVPIRRQRKTMPSPLTDLTSGRLRARILLDEIMNFAPRVPPVTSYYILRPYGGENKKIKQESNRNKRAAVDRKHKKPRYNN